MPTILALTHGAIERPGLLHTAAVERGFHVELSRVDQVDRIPDPGDFDAVFVLGANESVYDERIGWISPERATLQRAISLDVPVLGVCFGGQLLAQALGGQVAAAETQELGWLQLSTEDEQLVSAGPWLSWHGDVFTIPPGARQVAWSDRCPHAFSAGSHLGLQFHPEVTPELLEIWLDDADEHGVGVGPQRETLLADAWRFEFDSAGRARALLDQFLQRAGLLGTAGD